MKTKTPANTTTIFPATEKCEFGIEHETQLAKRMLLTGVKYNAVSINGIVNYNNPRSASIDFSMSLNKAEAIALATELLNLAAKLEA